MTSYFKSTFAHRLHPSFNLSPTAYSAPCRDRRSRQAARPGLSLAASSAVGPSRSANDVETSTLFSPGTGTTTKRTSRRLSELVFLTVIDGTANVNLYETGDAALIQTNIPSLMPTLSRKRDFRSYPSCGAIFQVINTTKPPLDDVRVRYALNMGTDKRAIAAFMGVGRTPARNLVPPIDGYDAPSSLPVTIDGVSCDVLAFNPQAARELLGKAIGTRPLRLEMLGPNLPEAKLLAQVFKHQWRETLGVELTLVTEELQTWIQSVFNKSYRGIAGWADYAGHLDPIWFLDAYRSESSAKWTGWTDPKYDAMLVEAGATTDRAERLRKLSECERYLLRAMPLVPLYADVWVYMRKPFVRGLGANPLDRQQFKYAWIDTNWRPQ